MEKNKTKSVGTKSIIFHGSRVPGAWSDQGSRGLASGDTMMFATSMRRQRCSRHVSPSALVFAIACLVVMPFFTEGVASSSQTTAPPRLVAIPDLHGDLHYTKRSLRLAGISQDDDDESWRFHGNIELVQTGDIVDRGEQSMAIVELFMALKNFTADDESQSVTALLGNHELMQLQHDFRYVAREEITKLGKESLERQNLGGNEMGTGYGLRAYWQAGQMRWRKAFSDGEPIGDEVRYRRPLLHVGGVNSCTTLFSHAGVRLAHLRKYGNSVEGVNTAAFDAIEAVSKHEKHETENPNENKQRLRPPFLGTLDLFDHDSPVWTRFWSDKWDGAAEKRACGELDEILNLTNTKRMVIGHTIQQPGMKTRCGKKLHLIDVGISKAYLGMAAAWVCERGTVTARYEGRVEMLETGVTEVLETGVEQEKGLETGDGLERGAGAGAGGETNVGRRISGEKVGQTSSHDESRGHTTDASAAPRSNWRGLLFDFFGRKGLGVKGERERETGNTEL